MKMAEFDHKNLVCEEKKSPKTPQLPFLIKGKNLWCINVNSFVFRVQEISWFP